MRREEEGRDGKDYGVCVQAFPLLPSPSPLHFKFAFAATFAQQLDWKRLLCTLNFASLRKHAPFSTLFRKLKFFFFNHLPIPWNDLLSHVIQSVKQSEFRVRIWIRLVSINHGLRTGYKTRTSNYVLGKAYNGLYSKNSSWKVKGKETDCGLALAWDQAPQYVGEKGKKWGEIGKNICLRSEPSGGRRESIFYSPTAISFSLQCKHSSRSSRNLFFLLTSVERKRYETL